MILVKFNFCLLDRHLFEGLTFLVRGLLASVVSAIVVKIGRLVELALLGKFYLALHAVELADLLKMVSFDLSESDGTLIESSQIGLQHVLGDVLLALRDAFLDHLLAGLLKFLLTGFEIAVDS